MTQPSGRCEAQLNTGVDLFVGIVCIPAGGCVIPTCDMCMWRCVLDAAGSFQQGRVHSALTEL